MLFESNEQLSIKEYFLQKSLWIWIVILILIIFGALIGIFGIYELVSTNDREIVTSNDIDNQVCEKTTDLGQITAYVSGGVVNPGVYILETGDRLNDLLETAGGVAKTADKEFVNKHLNLAKRLSDGDQYYIPTTAEIEEIYIAKFASSENGGNSQVNESEQIGPISINSSTKNELTQLVGIGQVRASKIIENRPYASLQELVTKSVISQSLMDEILQKITL